MMPSSAGYAPATTNDNGCSGVQIETFLDEGLAGLPSSSNNNNDTTGNSSRKSVRDRMLQRHDSMYSVNSTNYEDPSDNDLNVWQGAALLTADCMGTGLLALPEDIRVLGPWIGLGFLILNLPINFYAGTILSKTAAHVERVQAEENDIFEQRQEEVLNEQQAQEDETSPGEEEEHMSVTSKDRLMIESPKKNRGNRSKHYASVDNTDETDNGGMDDETDDALEHSPTTTEAGASSGPKTMNPHRVVHHDTATFDFVGMTQALFSSRKVTRIVMILFYTNIFLVLGDYILVMSHAVSALVGEEVLCLPEAGILASTLMYAVTQTRTMASLGRTASILSLTALFIVVVQCLWAVHVNQDETYVEASPEDFDQLDPSLLRKFSALGSIGFAVGSQKLFLNIRHELADRSKGPKSLGVSLSAFGVVYVGIILLAGSNPPGFLFDAIPPGWNRRLAGFLLWIHVVVSYSINSQAICASIDRLYFCNTELFSLNKKPRIRWLCLTGVMSVMAFVVANAIPFFKDLVAFIGALTSVPLSLVLPGIFYRHYIQVPLWRPTRSTVGSYALLVFAVVFLVAALAGSISSISMDWSNHGAPFGCH